MITISSTARGDSMRKMEQLDELQNSRCCYPHLSNQKTRIIIFSFSASYPKCCILVCQLHYSAEFFWRCNLFFLVISIDLMAQLYSLFYS